MPETRTVTPVEDNRPVVSQKSEVDFVDAPCDLPRPQTQDVERSLGLIRKAKALKLDSV